MLLQVTPIMIMLLCGPYLVLVHHLQYALVGIRLIKVPSAAQVMCRLGLDLLRSALARIPDKIVRGDVRKTIKSDVAISGTFTGS